MFTLGYVNTGTILHFFNIISGAYFAPYETEEQLVEIFVLRSSLKPKVPIARIFFAKIIGLSYVQTNSNRRKISKNLKLDFFGP